MAANMLVQAQAPCSQQMHTEQPSSLVRLLPPLPLQPSGLAQMPPTGPKETQIEVGGSQEEAFFPNEIRLQGEPSPPPPKCPEPGLAGRAHPEMIKGVSVSLVLGRGLFLSPMSSLKPHHGSSLYLRCFCWIWVMRSTLPYFLCCLPSLPEHYAFWIPHLGTNCFSL